MAKSMSVKEQHYYIDEFLRIAIQIQIDEFKNDANRSQLKFPTSLTHIERGYIHKLVLGSGGLKSKSYGKGAVRHVIVFKNLNLTYSLSYDAKIELNLNSRQMIFEFLKDYPLTSYEKTNIENYLKPSNNADINIQRFTIGTANIDQIPFIITYDGFKEFREKLQIFPYREHILNTINLNAVTVISGDTGTGKTTQIPQYILEEHSVTRKRCRIICTQPRRLAAISIAGRVAQERNEELGVSIGYQVRLESYVSRGTNLIYTTSGYLLRCLLGANADDTLFKYTTHIILDEVHERDKYTDFLLIVIKEALKRNPHLKVILMLATIDSNLFTRYFSNCSFVMIQGRQYDVETFYLENILSLIDYRNESMNEHLNILEKTKWNRSNENNTQKLNTSSTEHIELNKVSTNNKQDFDELTIKFINMTLERCWFNDNFEQFYYLVTAENIPIDYQHTETGMTALMIAAGKGTIIAIEKLLLLGANLNVMGPNGMTALTWAQQLHNKQDCIALLNKFSIMENKKVLNSATVLAATDNAINKRAHHNNMSSISKCDEQLLLECYLKSKSDEIIDHNLLFNIIKYIHHNVMYEGSILIFLPGYDDIVEQKDILEMAQVEHSLNHNIKIYTLHNNMKSIDQKDVFVPAQKGWRKIILSTNIAETSLTIDDVAYVIDCGQVKQKTYDSISGSTSLTSKWISKACAQQRCGRAGRTQTGFCFRLYSQIRFNSMEKFTIPEILCVPLTEICLNTKLLVRQESINEFLQKAIQPPHETSIKHSIHLLQQMGALTHITENITSLGMILVDLPVEVQYGKSIIYSLILKCLDPILTIVSALSIKEMFILTGTYEMDIKINRKRKVASNGTFSDHYVLLKLFQEWTENKANGQERQFCLDNSLNSGTLDMICAVRTQLLGYLRSLCLVRPRGTNNIHELNKNSANWPAVKACLTAGLYPNVCRISQKTGIIKSHLDKHIWPHVSSIFHENTNIGMKTNLLQMPSEWLIYGEKSHTNNNQCLIQHVTVVSSLTIALFSGSFNIPESNLIDCNTNISDSEHEVDEDEDNDDEDEGDSSDNDTAKNNNKETTNKLKNNKGQQQPESSNFINTTKPLTKFIIDDWIQFVTDTDSAYFIYHLRQKFNALFIKFIQNPINYQCNDKDNNCIATIVNLLKSNDIDNNFNNPTGVGARPSTVNLKFAPCYNYGLKETAVSSTEINEISSSLSLTSISSQQQMNNNRNNNSNNNYSNNKSNANYNYRNKNKICNIPLKYTATNSYSLSPTTTTTSLSLSSSQSNLDLTNNPYNIPLNDDYGAAATCSNAYNTAGRLYTNNEWNINNGRYFIIKAESKIKVVNTLNFNEWSYTTKVLSDLYNEKKKTFTDILLIFYVVARSKFYGIAKLEGDIDHPVISGIHTDELSVKSLRTHINNYYGQIENSVNGDELDPIIGRKICQLLLWHNIDM